jgi:hypothetical protein
MKVSQTSSALLAPHELETSTATLTPPGPRRVGTEGRLQRFAVISLIGWIIAIAVKGALLAFEVLGPPFSDSPPRNFASQDFILAFVVICALCVGLPLLTRLFFPARALQAIFIGPAIVILAGAIRTDSLLSLIATILFTACALSVGFAIVALVSPMLPAWPVTLSLSVSLGISTIGVLALLSALASVLRLAVVVALLALLTIVAVVTVAILGKHPSIPGRGRGDISWFALIILSLAVSLCVFAALSAFVPENQTDATRQHLPVAREIWQSGALDVFDPMTTSRQSVQGHILYAVTFGLGNFTAAKLLQVVVGLSSVLAVAAVGQLLSGRVAAVVGAVMFATMPIVLWENGHAFNDLLPVLLSVAAIICILLWQREQLRWMVLAGGLTAVGISSKLNMFIMAGAMVTSVLIVGSNRPSARGRLRGLLAFGCGGLIILPWAIRTAIVNAPQTTSAIPFAGVLVLIPPLAKLVGLERTPSAPASLPPPVGVDPFAGFQQSFGHAPSDLLGMPWFLTFQGKDLGFPVIGRGEIGVALLMLLPLIYFAPRNRATAMVGIVTLVSFVAWWATPFQIARHLLPTLALASALVGAGVAGLLARPTRTGLDKALVLATRGGLLLSLILVPFFFLPSSRTQMPISYLTGAETRQDYINRTIRSAVALQAATDFLPPDTPVVYYGGPWEAPQLYTESRLIFFPSHGMENDPILVLWYYDQLGAQHFIWNRADSSVSDWRSPTLSTSFLRQYTRILAGADDAYLFEVLPAGDTVWGRSQVTNLLNDPGLQDVKSKKGPWMTEGKSVVAKGVVALARRATLTQEVAATPGHAYLLETPMRCLDASGRGILTFRWLDNAGNVIDSTSEEVDPGQETTDQFLWRRAPEGVARVQAEFSMAGPSRCEYSGAALYDLG